MNQMFPKGLVEGPAVGQKHGGNGAIPDQIGHFRFEQFGIVRPSFPFPLQPIDQFLGQFHFPPGLHRSVFNRLLLPSFVVELFLQRVQHSFALLQTFVRHFQLFFRLVQPCFGQRQLF